MDKNLVLNKCLFQQVLILLRHFRPQNYKIFMRLRHVTIQFKQFLIFTDYFSVSEKVGK